MMLYGLAIVAAFTILSLGINIFVLCVILPCVRDMEAMVTWMRSEVDELGRVVTDLREASDAQSRSMRTVREFEDCGSTSRESGT